MSGLSTGIGQSTSKAFVKIRQAALRRASEELRRQRFDLDESLRAGRIGEVEYRSSLVRLIVKAKEVNDELVRLESLLRG